MNVKHLLIGLVIITLFSSCAASRMRKENMRQTVVSKARSFKGTPYKYGGTTTLGMDCSGLLMRSFESIDMYLPRSSEEQKQLGKKVKIEQLQPADLVFLALGKRRRKVTHVGLVTQVNGKSVYFIHASSSRGVIEENLMKEYYMKRFRQARRIIK